MTIGTRRELFLDHVLIFNGVAKSQVKKVDLPLEKMPGPLLNGELDAVISWEPFAQGMLKGLGANGSAYYGAPSYNRYTWNLAAQKSWIKENPEIIKTMVQALIQAADFMKKNPSEARKIAARYLKMDESEVSRIWGSTVFKITLGPSLLMRLEDQTRWAIKNKTTGAKTVPNFLNYIYFDGLAAVGPAAVTIAH